MHTKVAIKARWGNSRLSGNSIVEDTARPIINERFQASRPTGRCPMTARVDVLLVSLGTTHGLKTADRAFIELLEGAGASVARTATASG